MADHLHRLATALEIGAPAAPGLRAVSATPADDLIAALRQARDYFESTFASAPVGMVVAQASGAWLHANAAFGALVGASPEALEGRSFADVMDPAEAEADWERVRALGPGATLEVERTIRGAEGAERLVRVWFARLSPNGGTKARVVIQAHPVTHGGPARTT
jgi:PAS domain S-box-containing protein